MWFATFVSSTLVAEPWRSEQGPGFRNFEMTEHSGGSGSIPNHLAVLAPTFDPATDDVLEWSNKVSLLIQAWPSDKYRELSTRLILNSKGSAFQKLNLHQKEILVSEVAGVKKLVELVGGSWGQVPMEKQFDLVEKAVWRGFQKAGGRRIR